MQGICGTVCQDLVRCILPSVVLIKIRCRQPLRILASMREYTGSCASICFLVVWSVCVHYTNGIGDLCRGGLLLLLGCRIGVPVPQLVSFLFLMFYQFKGLLCGKGTRIQFAVCACVFFCYFLQRFSCDCQILLSGSCIFKNLMPRF